MFFTIPTRFISEELDLLREFHEQQEIQITNFITNIDDHIKTEWRESWQQSYADDPGELIEYPIARIGRVSSEDYDLKEIFTKVMPMYHRQSMLVSMWSLYECELSNYYSHVALTLKRDPKLPKKTNDKISQLTHILNCFKKLGCLNNQSQDFNEAIKKLNNEVRIIRNAWVHTGGKPKQKKIVKRDSELELIYGQVGLSPNYLEQAYKLMTLVSKELSDSVVEVIRKNKSAD